MFEATKYRTELQDEFHTIRSLSYGNPKVFDLAVRPLYKAAQCIVSEGHPHHLLGRVHNRDIGGPFLSIKAKIDLGSWKMEWSRSNAASKPAYEEYGTWIPTTTLRDFIVPIFKEGNRLLENAEEVKYHLDYGMDAPLASSNSLLDARGASIIDSVKPTNPVVDLAEFFGELISERKLFSVPGKSSTLSGEYLNYMFGIAPTVSTYQDLRKAYSNAEALLEQYSRDSGRLIRRRFDPEPEVNVTFTSESGKYPAMIVNTLPTSLVTTGRLDTMTTTTEKWSFSGAFTYHLPKEGILRDIRDMDKLYGVVPGIDTVYQLIPFSWLLDYFASTGSALSNINSFAVDGLVMPYAYIMRHRRIVTEYTWTGRVKGPTGTLSPRTFFAVTEHDIKERRAANPFGFGLTMEALSPRQLSIIAALGLSRA